MTQSTVITPSSTLGERVRAARHERGLSQSQLAGAELTKGFISQVETGVVRPSLRSLQILAARLGKSLEYFLGDERITAAKRATFQLLAALAAAERTSWDEVRTAGEAVLRAEPAPVERATALRLLATADLAGGDTERAFDRIREGLAAAPEEADPAERAELLYLRARAYAELGQLAAAAESFEIARDLVERYEVPSPRLRARIQVALGTMFRRLQRTASAMSAYEAALALASRSSELGLAARSYMGVAVAQYDAGELDQAIGNYQRALDLLVRISDTSLELSVAQSLAAVHLENGDPASAAELAERVRQRSVALGDEHWAAVAGVILGRVALNAGRPEEALRWVEPAERTLAAGGDELQRADALRVMGAAQGRLDRSDDAERSYRAAIALLERIGDVADRAAVTAEFARLLRARGRIEEAFDLLDRSQAAPGRSRH